jgi:CheY-like chemotaxis protein
MNGLQVCQQLRRLPGLEKSRIVALTGYGQEDDRRRSREAGFDAHIVKPVDLEALQKILDGTPLGKA